MLFNVQSCVVKTKKVMNFKEHINKNNIPKHVAIIMDGNGRWAKQQGMKRVFGHKNGIRSVRDSIESAGELGIGFLTLYAFSTENWSRPKFEINALMDLLVGSLEKELPELQKNNVRLQTIGQMESLPNGCQKKLKDVIEKTKENTGLTLVLALSYSARWETKEALKRFSEDVLNGKVKTDDIDENTIRNYLETKHIPDPELMIRTSGETRISNFLLWQMAYTEFMFIDKFWPDFRKDDFFEAIYNYQNRERRFGKTSDQLK